jgi:hypothetical protein
MTDETGYELTEKGHTALAEAYWRSVIAEEVRKKHLPICVCERCGNLAEGYIIQSVIETIKGKK